MKKIFNFIAFVLAAGLTMGLSACDDKSKTPLNDGVVTVDEMVGQWQVSGYVTYKVNGQPTIFRDEHTLTISKIDNETVEITDMLGLSTHFADYDWETQDKFTATVKNGTISIPAQLMTPAPSFVDVNTELYMCRYLISDAAGQGFAPNWKMGFDNIPIKSNMSIDLSLGGYRDDRINFDTDVYPTFIFLTQDSVQTYYYGWFYFNTVWKKI